MHTAVRRAIRVGRATALAIGVGVVLAVVLGFATVALAAVPGDPFKLGKVNVINNANTVLRGGSTSGPGLEPLLEVKRDGGGVGPALRVENANTGVIGGDGIEIKVGPGKDPISVNPEAGKAIFLNADRLDGKTEEDFLSASRIYADTALKSREGGPGSRVAFTGADLACDEGDVLIEAGATAGGVEDDLSTVTPASARSATILIQDNDGANNHRATLLCSDSSKPFRD